MFWEQVNFFRRFWLIFCSVDGGHILKDLGNQKVADLYHYNPTYQTSGGNNFQNGEGRKICKFQLTFVKMQKHLVYFPSKIATKKFNLLSSRCQKFFILRPGDLFIVKLVMVKFINKKQLKMKLTTNKDLKRLYAINPLKSKQNLLQIFLEILSYFSQHFSRQSEKSKLKDNTATYIIYWWENDISTITVKSVLLYFPSVIRVYK